MVFLINEFAEDKRTVERYLSNHTMPVIEHLAKCLLMKDNQSYNHWKKEIIQQISSVDKLKNTKKYPTEKQIYTWTYGKKQDIITDFKSMLHFFRNIEYDYNIKLKYENRKDLEQLCKTLDMFCVKYFAFLAKCLSTTGFLDKAKANWLIDDFVKNYS